jgi:hypothetical protein
MARYRASWQNKFLTLWAGEGDADEIIAAARTQAGQ